MAKRRRHRHVTRPEMDFLGQLTGPRRYRGRSRRPSRNAWLRTARKLPPRVLEGKCFGGSGGEYGSNPFFIAAGRPATDVDGTARGAGTACASVRPRRADGPVDR